MKMIKTSCGYMTAQEAKTIGDITREERAKKYQDKYPHRKSQHKSNK